MKKIDHLIALWCTLFVLLTLLSPESGGQNPNSRFALLESMSTEHSFHIDRFTHWGDDWARTPGPAGHYYSNKAPGAAFWAFPIYKILHPLFGSSKIDETHPPSFAYKQLVTLLTQTIPYALISFFLLRALVLNFSLSLSATLWGTVALLFGNTAVIFAGTFFGHTLTAFFLLTALLFSFQKKFIAFGFFLGFALLSEYTMALVVPLFLLLPLFVETEKQQRLLALLKCALGGVIPGALWCWYHTLCFGYPWLTAGSFQNPIFLDVKHLDHNIAGLFSWWPIPWDIGAELLIGGRRGLLFTNPWILLLMVISLVLFIKLKRNNRHLLLMVITFGSTLLLLLMNMSFGGWHAGASAGPRYLCALFPLWAIVGALLYDKIVLFSTPLKISLWITLSVAVIVRGAILATTVLAPHEEWLWSWLYHNFILAKSSTPLVRFCLYLSLFTALFLYSKRSEKSGRHSSFQGFK
ncbi:MAG: hypothetical protein HQK52_04435 [Oligoflexia bacterium]|nr:hypothetical protein [Oligoflexia bacterium]